MTVLRVTAKWGIGDKVETTEFSIGQPDDPRANWVATVIPEKTVLGEKPFTIYLGNATPGGILRSEIPAYTAGSMCAFYAGPLKILWTDQATNKLDLGRLALQIERSSASIEGRKPRKFLGLGVLNI
jgi:hypothetical protein